MALRLALSAPWQGRGAILSRIGGDLAIVAHLVRRLTRGRPEKTTASAVIRFTDGTLDLTTVFNQAPDAVDDTLDRALSIPIQRQCERAEFFRSVVVALYIHVHRGSRHQGATALGYKIPRVTSAILSLPYFSPDAIDITTPVRLGYNPTSQRRIFRFYGGGSENGNTIQRRL